VIVSIKTIDFPDSGGCGTLAAMDNSLYALEILVAERLTHARAEARRLAELTPVALHAS
jgi:hypothetical protein